MMFQNGANKSSKLEPWPSKLWVFEVLMDFGKLEFLLFFGAGKSQTKITNKSTFGRAEIEKGGAINNPG